MNLSDSPQWLVPTGSEWRDPEVFAVNKCEPRTTSRFLPLSDGHDSQSWRSLDGPWQFNWVPSVSLVPEAHWEPQFEDTDWDQVEVPSNWELQGYGNLIYAPANLPRSLRGSDLPNIDENDAPGTVP